MVRLVAHRRRVCLSLSRLVSSLFNSRPIGNPLHFDQPDKDPFQINHGRYHELCEGSGWRDVTLRDIAQLRQEEFFAKWVGEMIRIAKPGKPVIVEHVSRPKCESLGDWGRFSLFVAGISGPFCCIRFSYPRVVFICINSQGVFPRNGGRSPLTATIGRLIPTRSSWKMITFIAWVATMCLCENCHWRMIQHPRE